jgi:hypothetical protein
LTGLTLAIFLLSSKGFSPQFLIFVLPFVILLFPDWRGVLYSVLLTVLNVLEQPLFFVFAPQASLVLDWIVVVRWLILAVLAVEPVRRFLPVGLSVIVGLGLIFCLPTIGSTYWQRQLDEDPAAAMIGYLNTTQARSQAGLVLVSQQDLLHRLYPFLGRSYKMHLLGGDKMYQAAPDASALIGDVKRVWVVAHDTEAGPDEIARNLVQETGESSMVYEFDEGYSLLLMATQPLMSAPPPLARVASGANLVGYQVERPSGREVMVRLYWWAGGPMTRSYTVFAHVLDEQGDYVAGHDSFPANREAPTHTWQAGHVYADRHLIELPDDLPPGQYRIVVGMYDVDLERLVARGPDAEVFDDYAIPLGEIRLP